MTPAGPIVEGAASETPESTTAEVASSAAAAAALASAAWAAVSSMSAGGGGGGRWSGGDGGGDWGMVTRLLVKLIARLQRCCGAVSLASVDGVVKSCASISAPGA